MSPGTDPSVEASASEQAEPRAVEALAAEQAAARALAAEADLGSRATTSTFWTVGGLAAANVVRLISNFVLAYLLIKEEFGLSGLIAVFVMGLGMFSDVGIGPSIVHSKRGEEVRFLDTAWTIQVLRGFALWGVACLVARPYADFFERTDPLYADFDRLIPVAALMTVIQGFNSTRIFTAERNLALAKKIQGDLFGQVMAVIVMISWALVSPTVWALIACTLTQSFCVMVWSHTMIPGERNRFAFDRDCAAELFGFGRWIFVSTLITFFAMQIDRLLIGTELSAGDNGVYTVAMGITNIPQYLLGVLTGTVIFPLLAQYRRERPEVLAEKFRSQRVTLLIGALVMGLGVGLLSRPFFLLYRTQYHDAGWIAGLFMVPTWFFLLTVTSDRALLALGRPKALALSNLAAFGGKLLGGYWGYRLGGVPGFLFGLSLGTVLCHLVVQVALRLEGLDILRQDLRFTGYAMALGGLGYGLQYLASQRLEGAGLFVAWSAVGLVLVLPLGLILFQRLKRVGITG
jgi:O-antigen/teichoic acid export membrane protein